ncbi:pro-sigmaK processing inhibitor BofA family protein [Candidatus Micrarchaeota archaeon]|nr:pro-sigmaK processing inhibitor BofA family protein [Candidatus Micrarchaeota archaeon]
MANSRGFLILMNAFSIPAAIELEIGSVGIALVVLLLLFIFIQNPIALLINSIVAILILFLLNAIFSLGIPINIITILIVALGGVLGLVLVILLRLMKVAFV